MAWTAPITFTVGQLVDAATLNQQIRDNFTYLSDDHQHYSGQAGEGSPELFDVNQIGVDTPSEPSNPGSSTIRIYRDTTSGNLVYKQDAAGPETAFSEEGHTH